MKFSIDPDEILMIFSVGNLYFLDLMQLGHVGMVHWR